METQHGGGKKGKTRAGRRQKGGELRRNCRASESCFADKHPSNSGPQSQCPRRGPCTRCTLPTGRPVPCQCAPGRFAGATPRTRGTRLGSTQHSTAQHVMGQAGRNHFPSPWPRRLERSTPRIHKQPLFRKFQVRHFSTPTRLGLFRSRCRTCGECACSASMPVAASIAMPRRRRHVSSAAEAASRRASASTPSSEPRAQYSAAAYGHVLCGCEGGGTAVSGIPSNMHVLGGRRARLPSSGAGRARRNKGILQHACQLAPWPQREP